MAHATFARVLISAVVMIGFASTSVAGPLPYQVIQVSPVPPKQTPTVPAKIQVIPVVPQTQSRPVIPIVSTPTRSEPMTMPAVVASDVTIKKPIDLDRYFPGAEDKSDFLGHMAELNIKPEEITKEDIIFYRLDKNENRLAKIESHLKVLEPIIQQVAQLVIVPKSFLDPNNGELRKLILEYCATPPGYNAPTYDGMVPHIFIGGDGWCNFSYGGGGCFTRRMRVRMWNRKKKRIDELVLGDEVLSIDLRTGALCMGTVGRIFVHEELTELLVLNGTLEVTPNHPFWSRGSWVEAQHLQLGDVVTWLGADGEAGEPGSIVIESKDSVPLFEPVYNIELAESHLEAYFVEDFLVQH